MVTSKQLSVDFFFQVSLPKNSKDFLQCMIKQRSLSSMVVCSFANWMAFVKMSFLGGNCQVNNVVYKCDITRLLPKKLYLGLAEQEWKGRLYNYKLSFKHKRYSNKTALLSYMWYLKSVLSEPPNLK